MEMLAIAIASNKKMINFNTYNINKRIILTYQLVEAARITSQVLINICVTRLIWIEGNIILLFGWTSVIVFINICCIFKDWISRNRTVLIGGIFAFERKISILHIIYKNALPSLILWLWIENITWLVNSQ